jgi:hypothetical protein
MQPRPTWSELSLFEARHLRLGQLDAHASRSGARRVAAVRAHGQIELGQLPSSQLSALWRVVRAANAASAKRITPTIITIDFIAAVYR